MSELSVGQLKGLPVNDNVVTVPSGHTLYAPGHVIQVVQTVRTSVFSASVAGGVASSPAIEAIITPKFASSKVLCLVEFNGSVTGVSALYAYLFRGGSVSDYRGDADSSRVRVASATGGGSLNAVIPYGGTISYLDSPNTTSPVTYDLRLGQSGSTQTVYLNRGVTDLTDSSYGRTASSITLMEIAQ
jgi:hypothetical protein